MLNKSTLKKKKKKEKRKQTSDSTPAIGNKTEVILDFFFPLSAILLRFYIILFWKGVDWVLLVSSKENCCVFKICLIWIANRTEA